MEGQPKVSVIIPVYNVEQFLRECLESLIHQTLKEIELIFVDDGSTDSSYVILEEYAAKDDRIKVLQQKNKHAGVARNLGLENAKGEYVIFLDSDDCFSLDMLQKSYAKAVKTEADIVLFDAQKFDSKTGKYNEEYHYLKQNYLPSKAVFSYKDIPSTIFQISTPNPWTKLFRRSFVIDNGLQFQSLINSNDVYFVYLAMCLAQKIAVVNASLAFYRVNTGTSLQDQKAKDPCCFIEAYKALYDSLNALDIWETVKRSFANAVVSTAVFNLDNITDLEIRYRLEEALFAVEFRKTGYLNLGMKEYEYPEKYFKLRRVLTEYTTRRLNGICPPPKPNVEEHVPLVSVIMPVYNVESWLEESVHSIMNQTLEDIEIICVNDGSTDGSPEILKNLASVDSRITIITQPNGGLSAARNAGMKYAHGEYIYFFDSDDLLKSDALEYLYGEAQQYDFDVLLFDAETLFETEELKMKHEKLAQYYLRDKAYDDVLTGENIYSILRNANMYRCSVCIQFVKRRFLEKTGITFLHGIIHEDELYTLQLLLKAKRVSHRRAPLFIRRVRENSIMATSVSFMNCYAYFRVVIDSLKWLEQEGIELEETTEDVLDKWLRYQVRNVRNIYNQLAWKQKKCVQEMPISERILFESWMEQPVKSVNVPKGNGMAIKSFAKRLVPKYMRPFVKRQLLRIPHKTKVAIKRIIRW